MTETLLEILDRKEEQLRVLIAITPLSDEIKKAVKEKAKTHLDSITDIEGVTTEVDRIRKTLNEADQIIQERVRVLDASTLKDYLTLYAFRVKEIINYLKTAEGLSASQLVNEEIKENLTNALTETLCLGYELGRLKWN